MKKKIYILFVLIFLLLFQFPRNIGTLKQENSKNKKESKMIEPSQYYSISVPQLWNISITDPFSEIVLDAKINDDLVACRTSDHKLVVFDKNGNELWNITTYEFINYLILSENNHILISTDTNIVLFSSLSKIPLWNFTLTFVEGVEMSKNGKYICADDGTYLYLLNDTSATLKEPIWIHEMWTNFIDYDFSYSGENLVAISWIWLEYFSVASNESIWEDSVHDSMFQYFSSVDMDDTGEYMATTSHHWSDPFSQGYLQIYSNESEDYIWYDADGLEKVYMSNKHNCFFYSTVNDVNAHINFFNQPELTGWARNFYTYTNAIDMSNDGKYQLAVSDSYGILLWNRDVGTIWECEYNPPGFSADLTESGDFFVVGIGDRIICFEIISRWDFAEDTIIGWRQYSSFSGVSDNIYVISNLKYYDESENVTGSNKAYYGVALTPAFWNITTGEVEEFVNRTVFPILNVSLINYTIPSENGFSNRNMYPSSDFSPDNVLTLFIPKNSSDVLDIHWCANATHWLMSTYLNGVYDEETGGLKPPQTKEELVELTVTSNSIHYINPARGTYCHLFYYDNGTLRTGEIYTYFSPEMNFKINKTRIFDFNPLNELKWSTKFDESGEILYYGVEHNETKVEFDHITNNMSLVIEYDENENKYHGEIVYYQQIWANISNWDYNNEEWIYLNTTAVSCANDISPLEFRAFGDDDENGEGDTFIPPLLLIPEQGTELRLDEIFELFEFYFEDLFIESGDNWVKFTNTTNSKFNKISYFSDGILKYLYIQGVFPFEYEDEYDTDLMIFYKNCTAIEGDLVNLYLTCFDLVSISASVNISIKQATDFFHSGFPYNPTNQSKLNAIAYFDLLIADKIALDHINITIYYDYTKYTNIQFYWFNISANQGKGEWEEIPLINLGNGIIIITLNHTSIFVLTGDKISTLPSEDGGGKDKEEKKPAAIPLGNYYLVFMVLAVIGLIIYKKQKLDYIE